MKKLKNILVFLLAGFLLVAGCSGGGNDEATEQTDVDQSKDNVDSEVVAVAENFIDQMNEGQYEAAVETFDETMAEQLGAEELEELWESLLKQLGDFIEYEYDETHEVDGFQVVFLKGIFNDQNAILQVTVDDDKNIAGFFVR